MILGLFCFIKKGRRAQPKTSRAAITERNDMPAELSSEDSKAKQELEGGAIYEKANVEHMTSELPAAPMTDVGLHEDGRYDGQSEMPA